VERPQPVLFSVQPIYSRLSPIGSPCYSELMRSDGLACKASSLLFQYNPVFFRERLALTTAYSILVSCLAFSSACKIEATRFSEILVHIHRTICPYIPENTTLSVNSGFVTQTIPKILWNPKAYNHNTISLTLDPILSQLNSTHIFKSYFKILSFTTFSL
jgi:hypothetical protein